MSRSEVAAAWEGVLGQDRRGEAPDVVGFRDAFTAHLEGTPAPPISIAVLPVPRRSSAPAVRLIHVLDPTDHARYRALMARLVPTVERRLGGCVVADRAVVDAGGLHVEPWRRARRRYREQILRLLARRPGAVLVADVRDCFGRIRPQVVAEVLTRMGCDGGDVAKLVGLLRRIEASGVSGLPVGPEPSAVLANAVLSEADRAVAGEGGRHVRWVDDYLVGVQEQSHAFRVLECLRAALGCVGLEVAEEKCRVLSEEEMKVAFCREPSGFPEGGPADRPHLLDPDRSFTRLEATPSKEHAATELTEIRSVVGRRWGGAEGALFLRVALDAARAQPVRAWAWRALAATDPAACLRAAAEEVDRDASVARAVVASVGTVEGRGARRLLKKLARRGDGTDATVKWALAVGPDVVGAS